VVPCQVVRLGPLAIAAVPFEPTTVAGRRLRQTLLEVLAPTGVQAVVLNPYANAYAGYLTTFEEYQVQHYEAGYTVFGPWELAAVRTALATVAGDLVGGRPGRAGPEPPRIPAELLARQAYGKAWSAFT
jgi:neutral ceramidase